MKTYKIVVHSLGYEDTVRTVRAESLEAVRRQRRGAISEWIKHNALEPSDKDLPFVTITRQTA